MTTLTARHALSALLEEPPELPDSVLFSTAREQLRAMIDTGEFMLCAGDTHTMLHGFVMFLDAAANRALLRETAIAPVRERRGWLRAWL